MLDKIKGIVVEQLGVDADQVTEDASFVDDLGADSLDTVELIMAFEEEFDIAAQNLNRLLEPAVIIFLATVVGTLIFAIYYPIFTLGQAMMQQTQSSRGQ